MSLALDAYKMDRKILFTILALIISIQSTNGKDPRVVKCYNTIENELKKIDFTNCFDPKSLEAAKQLNDVAKVYYKKYSLKCNGNSQWCMTELAADLTAKKDQIRNDIVHAIVSIIKGGQKCLNLLISGFKNADVRNGCM